MRLLSSYPLDQNRVVKLGYLIAMQYQGAENTFKYITIYLFNDQINRKLRKQRNIFVITKKVKHNLLLVIKPKIITI